MIHERGILSRDNQERMKYHLFIFMYGCLQKCDVEYLIIFYIVSVHELLELTVLVYMLIDDLLFPVKTQSHCKRDTNDIDWNVKSL